MALKPGDEANFNTLMRACKDENLALLECTDTKTGEYVAVVCAVQIGSKGEVEVIPLAKLFQGNPYDEVQPSK